MEQINSYLYDNYDASIVDDDNYGDYFDRGLQELILAYGASERKEGYKKGFEDGEEEMACK